MDLLNGEHYLLRRESFGGTLFSVKRGKRIYINHDEYLEMKLSSCITQALANELGEDIVPVVITEPQHLPNDNFSAPDTVFLEVTRACNLHCIHCFNASGKQLPKQLSHTQFESVIEDLVSSGVQEIRFTGGEPMVVSGIISLIRRASELGIRTSMGTNAALINDDKAGALAKAGLRAGIISFDGLESRHDQIRGKGSFKLAIDGLERLRQYNISVRVNIVVMRSNLSDISKLIKFLHEIGVSVFIRRLILSGRASATPNEMLTSTEYSELRKSLQTYLDDPKNLVDGHSLKERRVQMRITLPFTRKDCSAGHRGLIILPDGRIQTCGFLGPLGETSIGRVLKEHMADIWQRLNMSNHIEDLEKNLEPYNQNTVGPSTNCLAVALAEQKHALVQIRRSKQETY